MMPSMTALFYLNTCQQPNGHAGTHTPTSSTIKEVCINVTKGVTPEEM